jgi:DNA adenine methylase
MMSFLRWAGSKRQLLPILTEIISDDFERYVEPFAGSACVFFELVPDKALLGDINAELIRTYIEVKYRVEDVIMQLAQWRKSKERYFELRALEPESLPSAMRAARFIYLNRCCFNGLYRTNRQGRFNVPYGGTRSGQIPSSDSLRAASKALKKANLLTGDFTRALQEVQPGDFVYMDPPFSITARRMFNEYDATAFDVQRVKQLRVELEKLADSGIKFLVSYADSDEADFLKNGFRSVKVPVRRNIAGFARNRRVAQEVLIFSTD